MPAPQICRPGSCTAGGQWPQGGSAVALKRDAQRAPRKDDAEARYKAELDRLRAVVAEITAENPELKKRSEAGRFVPCPRRNQSARDADRRSYGRRSGWQVYPTLAAWAYGAVCITYPRCLSKNLTIWCPCLS